MLGPPAAHTHICRSPDTHARTRFLRRRMAFISVLTTGNLAPSAPSLPVTPSNTARCWPRPVETDCAWEGRGGQAGWVGLIGGRAGRCSVKREQAIRGQRGGASEQAYTEPRWDMAGCTAHETGQPTLGLCSQPDLRGAHDFIQRRVGARQHAALPQQQPHAVALTLHGRKECQVERRCGRGSNNMLHSHMEGCAAAAPGQPAIHPKRER